VLRHLGDDTSRSTSPLTSLSSSSDDDDRRRELAQIGLEEMYAKSDAALSLLSLHERVSQLRCCSPLLVSPNHSECLNLAVDRHRWSK